MDGRAIIWWNRLYSLNKCPNDWANFKELLNSEFKPLFAILKQGTSSVQDYVYAMQYILLEATDIDQEPINEDNVTGIRQLRENDLLLKNI